MLRRLKHGFTDPITDEHGETVPGSVASLERVLLGGVPQSVLLRGASADLPLLLFLHGGPGTSEMGLLRRDNLPTLERHFLVVLWDQRGAGKSFSALNPTSRMTLEQIVSDACELIEELCARFGKEKLFLAGHSWGSVVGAFTAQRIPERIHAYVGIGQVANMLEGERLSHAWTLAQAREAGDTRSVAKLESLGEPPYAEPMRPKVIAQRTILARYGGEVHGNPRGAVFLVLRSLFGASEYAWVDRLNYFRGSIASMDLLWEPLMGVDLFTQVPELEVPVHFLLGRHDHEVPSALSERYYEALVAPRKELVWFENSAHFPSAEEPEAFNRFFARDLLAAHR